MECEFYDMPLFRGCDRTLVDPILEKSPSRIANYRKGEFIAMQNSVCRSLLLLCEGSVRVQMTNEEGREFTLDTLAAPDVLASAFLFATEIPSRYRSSPTRSVGCGSSAGRVCLP